jgi:hypothetical protein
MTTYEQLVINGVPFLHSNGKLYYYELLASAEPVEIGVVNSGALQLSTGWAERIQPRVDAWRESLAPSERGKTVRAPKPSKPKRSPKSAAAAPAEAGEAGGAGTGRVAAKATDTGVVAKATATDTTSAPAPEPRPKRVLRRRAAPGTSP